MRNVIFLILALITMSAVSVNAQVRIGGLDDPNESAVLDLNASDATDDGTLGLALPRVDLTSTAAVVKKGMIVYNTVTAGGFTPGMYYNDGEKWIRIGTSVSELDGIIENGITDATSNGGLTKSGSGTASSPYTLGIATSGVTAARISSNAVTTAKIANGAVTAVKLDDMSTTDGQVLMYNDNAWSPTTLSVSAYSGSGSVPCTGAIVFGGAYNGPAYNITGVDMYATDLYGPFDPNWSNSVFSIQGKDLCWAKTGISGTKTWADAKTACADLTTDGRLWRLPNLKELQVLYEAIGGKGISTTELTALDIYGYGESNGASAMLSDFSYWSSTESSSEIAYYFNFNYGIRGYNSKTTSLSVRCVRSL
jgi:hypothetical protein